MLRAARRRSSSKDLEGPRLWPEYRDDPAGFIANVLGRKLWGPQPGRENSQAGACQAIADHDATIIRASTGVGKTFLAGALVPWWLHTRINSGVVTTSSKFLQVRTQTWRNVRAAIKGSKSKLGGRLLDVEYRLGEEWYGIGLTARDPVGLAGFHFPGGVLVIIDEASGVPDEMWDAIDGLLTDPGSKILAIGNPTALSGRYFQILNPRRGGHRDGRDLDWARYHLSAYDAPPEIVSPDWIERMAHDCGPNPEKNPRFRVRVLGEFPLSTERSLYPLELIEACAGVSPKVGGVHMGVDIGRHGGDPCVAVLLIRNRVRAIKVWSMPDRRKADLMKSARIIRELAAGWKVPAGCIHVDVTGIGWGVYDRLWEYGVPCDAVNFGAGAVGEWRNILGHPPPMRSRRQELHWVLLRLFQEELVSVPDTARYGGIWSDLADIEYAYSKADEFRVEAKDQFRKRTGRSPDYSDALLCALSRTDPVRVRFRALGSRQPRRRSA